MLNNICFGTYLQLILLIVKINESIKTGLSAMNIISQ